MSATFWKDSRNALVARSVVLKDGRFMLTQITVKIASSYKSTNMQSCYVHSSTQTWLCTRQTWDCEHIQTHTDYIV